MNTRLHDALRRVLLLTLICGLLLAPLGTAPASGEEGEEQEDTVACKIIMPRAALSARGLATPWMLSGVKGKRCDEAKKDQAAFIDATILDPATGRLFIYRPLVVTKGTEPAVAPEVPALPAGAIVEISVGYNGDELTLADRSHGRDIAAAKCVNGLGASVFGQEIFCNAPAFFQAANPKARLPARRKSPGDGHRCPTTESWEIVDQDQSDNTTTRYLLHGRRTAQNTAANRRRLGTTAIANGSDNNVYTSFYGPAIHCAPPRTTDITDPANPVPGTSSALLNLHARALRDETAALVPADNPFVLVGDERSLRKLNLYRAQVNEPPAATLDAASTAAYCRNLLRRGLTRIQADKTQLQAFGASPDPQVSDDLHLFLLNRFKETWDNLDCKRRIKRANPVRLKTDKQGVVRRARIDLDPDRLVRRDATERRRRRHD